MAYVPHAKIDLFAADDVFGKRLKYLQAGDVFEEEPTNTAMAAARHFLMAHANLRTSIQKPVDIAENAVEYEWQITPSASMLTRRLVDPIAADCHGVSQASSQRSHGGKKRSKNGIDDAAISTKFSFATETGNMVYIRATFLLKDASLPALDALLPESAVPKQATQPAPPAESAQAQQPIPQAKQTGKNKETGRTDTNMSSRTTDGPTGKIAADSASLADDARSITSGTGEQDLLPVTVVTNEPAHQAYPGWGAGSFAYRLPGLSVASCPSLTSVASPPPQAEKSTYATDM